MIATSTDLSRTITPEISARIIAIASKQSELSTKQQHDLGNQLQTFVSKSSYPNEVLNLIESIASSKPESSNILTVVGARNMQIDRCLFGHENASSREVGILLNNPKLLESASEVVYTSLKEPISQLSSSIKISSAFAIVPSLIAGLSPDGLSAENFKEAFRASVPLTNACVTSRTFAVDLNKFQNDLRVNNDKKMYPVFHDLYNQVELYSPDMSYLTKRLLENTRKDGNIDSEILAANKKNIIDSAPFVNRRSLLVLDLLKMTPEEDLVMTVAAHRLSQNANSDSIKGLVSFADKLRLKTDTDDTFKTKAINFLVEVSKSIESISAVKTDKPLSISLFLNVLETAAKCRDLALMATLVPRVTDFYLKNYQYGTKSERYSEPMKLLQLFYQRQPEKDNVKILGEIFNIRMASTRDPAVGKGCLAAIEELGKHGELEGVTNRCLSLSSYGGESFLAGLKNLSIHGKLDFFNALTDSHYKDKASMANVARLFTRSISKPDEFSSGEKLMEAGITISNLLATSKKLGDSRRLDLMEVARRATNIISKFDQNEGNSTTRFSAFNLVRQIIEHAEDKATALKATDLVEAIVDKHTQFTPGLLGGFFASVAKIPDFSAYNYEQLINAAKDPDILKKVAKTHPNKLNSLVELYATK